MGSSLTSTGMPSSSVTLTTTPTSVEGGAGQGVGDLHLGVEGLALEGQLLLDLDLDSRADGVLGLGGMGGQGGGAEQHGAAGLAQAAQGGARDLMRWEE